MVRNPKALKKDAKKRYLREEHKQAKNPKGLRKEQTRSHRSGVHQLLHMAAVSGVEPIFERRSLKTLDDGPVFVVA